MPAVQGVDSQTKAKAAVPGSHPAAAYRMCGLLHLFVQIVETAKEVLFYVRTGNCKKE